MPNIREEVEKILEYVYSCDVKSDKQDKDKVIKQAAEQILQAVNKMLPKRIEKWIGVTTTVKDKITGFNDCLAQIRERIGR